MPTNEYMREYMKARYHRQRREAIERMGGECARCGSTDDLQLDHITEGDKSYDVARIWSQVEWRGEVTKCQVLCGPCHKAKTREWHRRSLADMPHGKHRFWARGCRCEVCRADVNKHRREQRRRKAVG